MKKYWQHVRSFFSLWKSLWLSLKHLRQSIASKKSTAIQSPDYFTQQRGLQTIQYPFEKIPVPDVGRYKLDCEIDDCIVCDQCVKICPVDCIEIESVRSPETIARTSNHSPIKIHATKFDIDMAKCCFCGLCTTVCPTECLVMTPDYEYATTQLTNHNFAFAKMTSEEIEQAKTTWENFQRTKNQAKPA